MDQTSAIDQLLDPKQVHAAALLSAGHPIDEVRQSLSVGRVTLYRRRQEPLRRLSQSEMIPNETN